MKMQSNDPQASSAASQGREGLDAPSPALHTYLAYKGIGAVGQERMRRKGRGG